MSTSSSSSKTRGKTPEETAAAFLRLRQISLRQGKASGGPETPERLWFVNLLTIWPSCWPFDQAHVTESDQYRFQRSNLACVHPNMTKVKLLQLLRLCKAIYFPAWSLISESKLFYFWILIKRITYHNSDNVPEIYMKTVYDNNLANWNRLMLKDNILFFLAVVSKKKYFSKTIRLSFQRKNVSLNFCVGLADRIFILKNFWLSF